MSRHHVNRIIGNKLAALTGLALGFAFSQAVFGAASGASPAPDPAGTARHVPPPPAVSSIDSRVKTFALALKLDTDQKAKLKKVLENQRDEVRRVWNDSSVPAVYRVNATRIISDKTADRIRALLTEEQRKKYNEPRQARDPSVGHSGPSVEDWMAATRAKPPAIVK
jgi:hypothetical protein